ncbi:alpha/beta hydrolase [Salipiger bermudensis]|uniref:Lipoprotein n=1 Tax=Salipiger bermudensis (strain DSM 26914 / JCM 13377 / KCTC 12554 / HTCC2601) TaxID=314265 RepID=Q0FMY2_SALBH|nr:alpha/beta hydrolase [Salipiger bermudensis]EAU45520.1 hypothetical protein R2601_17998 [Salipiger bermudensis HTCC2601]
MTTCPSGLRFLVLAAALSAALWPSPAVRAETVAAEAVAEAAAPRGVPYLTIRNRTGLGDPRKFYGDERSDLKAGWCDIGERRLPMLSSVAEAAPFYIPEEILRVDGIRESAPAALLDAFETGVEDAAPVLFTHGFYIDFEKGCRRATALQENAGLMGQFLWFSWPSNGDALNYTHDEADLYWSVPNLADTISELEGRFGPGRVNMAGHSLGARGVALALAELASRNSGEQLGEVVLLAPDMDFGIFERLLPRIRPLATSITVYVTERDWPLALSAQLHGYPRLGEAGNPVEALDGVEVIDLSDLQVRSSSGHLYHIYNPEVGDDLAQLFKDGLHAAERRNLVQDGPNLWRLQPAQ